MEKKWTSIIEPKNSLFHVNIKEIYEYRDLIFLFVKRDFVSLYKQTILGPLWFIIQPLITTLIFVFVFNKIANISTNETPPILFYLAGLTCWNYFSEILLKTSNTFIENQNIFGKVYFPRLVTPISILFSSLLKFFVQFGLFLSIYFYFLLFKGLKIDITWFIGIIPILIILTGLLGFGFGIIITSLTTKYRDLKFLIQFGIQLWMYATPIIYPLSELEGKARTVALLNPMTSIIEAFKYAFFGVGEFQATQLLYPAVFSIILVFFGILVFNKTQKNFMDIV